MSEILPLVNNLLSQLDLTKYNDLNPITINDLITCVHQFILYVEKLHKKGLVITGQQKKELVISGIQRLIVLFGNQLDKNEVDKFIVYIPTLIDSAVFIANQAKPFLKKSIRRCLIKK